MRAIAYVSRTRQPNKRDDEHDCQVLQPFGHRLPAYPILLSTPLGEQPDLSNGAESVGCVARI